MSCLPAPISTAKHAQIQTVTLQGVCFLVLTHTIIFLPQTHCVSYEDEFRIRKCAFRVCYCFTCVWRVCARAPVCIYIFICAYAQLLSRRNLYRRVLSIALYPTLLLNYPRTCCCPSDTSACTLHARQPQNQGQRLSPLRRTWRMRSSAAAWDDP